MRWLESLAEATSLDAYRRAIARYPELSIDEERMLAARVRRRDEAALTRLAGSQLERVLSYAEIYRHLGVPLADLVHEGNLALVDAARRFVPERHGRFSSYSAWWVRQGILHRVSLGPRSASSLDAETRAEYLATALGVAVERACGGADVEQTAWPAEDVRLLDEPWKRSPVLDRLDDEDLDLDEIGSTLVDEGGDAVRGALASELESSLLDFEPKERRTLELRLGLLDGEPRTADQTGARLKISPSRVERLSARAVHKLRRQRAVRSPLN